MGAFSPEPYDNDFALDWLEESSDARDARDWINRLFDEVGSRRPLDADAASFVIATAAALLDSAGVYACTPPKSAPSSTTVGASQVPLGDWLRLRELLCACVNSELATLWVGAQEAAGHRWRTIVGELVECINGLERASTGSMPGGDKEDPGGPRCL